MKVFINLSSLKNKAELHNKLSLLLPLPEYYGGNLDALSDSLDEVEEELDICVYGRNNLSGELGEYVEKMMLVLKRTAEDNPHISVREEI